jgi:hypothetical protein
VPTRCFRSSASAMSMARPSSLLCGIERYFNQRLFLVGDELGRSGVGVVSRF